MNNKILISIGSEIKHLITDGAIDKVGGDYDKLLCSWLNVNCPSNFYDKCRTRTLSEEVNKLEDNVKNLTEDERTVFLEMEHMINEQSYKPCNLELAVGRDLDHRMPPKLHK
jgi:hypothetical protein